MATASITREQVKTLLDELPADRLPEVARFVRALLGDAENDTCPPSSAPETERSGAAGDEARLIEIARRTLQPDAAARLRDLRAREAAGRLSNGERTELLALEGRAERIDTERTMALLALARIRNVDVAEVVRDLGLSGEAKS